MNGYILARGVEFDLSEIWERIAADSVDVADKWIGKFFGAFDLLAANPKIGHTRKDWTSDPVLFWPVGSFLVVYRSAGDKVEIVAVVRGERDMPSFLKRRV